MHADYSAPCRGFFRRLFGSAKFSEKTIAQLDELHQQGPLVHVVRGHSTWVALYFNHAFLEAHLPLPDVVTGVRWLWPWQPVQRALQLLRQWLTPPHISPSATDQQLALQIQAGHSAYLAMPVSRTGATEHLTSFEALVAAQRAAPERPIFVIPHILTDGWQAGRAGGTLVDKVLGSRRNQGTLRHLASLFSTFRRATLRTGDPIDLRALLQAHPQLDDLRLARTLSHALNRSMDAEQRVLAGPELPPFERTARHVLRDPQVQHAVEAEATRTGRSQATLLQRALQHLRSIAARYDIRYIHGCGSILHWVFHRIYDGIIVDDDGLQRALETARHGSVIFCPSHRSHVDYLVLSYLLWKRGIAPPHIAAGANLSFFPLGTIFRRSGAFFLRRTFRDDALYASVFRAYLAELLRTRTSIEFFPEGTRSRTGKLLLPKFGMFSMIIDAWRSGDLRNDDITFIPVSVDYERVIEAGAYHKELAGAQKQKEDLTGLLRTTSVLRSRYGRVHLQFGEPISLNALTQAQHLEINKDPSHDDAWRAATERLGFQIMYGVAQACTVTPTAVVATALLGFHRRGIGESALIQLCSAVIDYLSHVRARLTPALRSSSGRQQAILEAVQKLLNEGVVAVDRPGRGDGEPIYNVPENNRIYLDFHKNAVMNHFAPGAIIARVLTHAASGTTVARSDAWEDIRFLSRLFKIEFLFPVGVDFDTVCNQTLAMLEAQGFIRCDGDAIHIHNELAMGLLAGLLDNFIESYWSTACVLRELRTFPLWQKELISRALESTRRAFLEGTISRPESASRTLIENALAWCAQQGFIQRETHGKRQNIRLDDNKMVSGEHASLEVLIAHIARFL